MKTILRIVIGLMVAASPAFAAADDGSAVSLVVGPTHFKDGDSITIEQVVATTPNLAVGDKVTVRGRYELRTEEKAQLCLYVTTKEAVPVPTVPSQQTEAKRGSGEFELTTRMTQPGFLHVSFYRVSNGKRFGSIYFGTEQQMKECNDSLALDGDDNTEASASTSGSPSGR